MRHRTIKRFWECYGDLPANIQELADEKFQLLKENHRHPSLRFKKVGTLWSARVGLVYRALAVEDGDDFIWVWIGSHDDYERILKRR